MAAKAGKPGENKKIAFENASVAEVPGLENFTKVWNDAGTGGTLDNARYDKYYTAGNDRK